MFKDLPVDGGDMVAVPDAGSSRILQSNSQESQTAEAPSPGAGALQQENPPQREASALQ